MSSAHLLLTERPDEEPRRIRLADLDAGLRAGEIPHTALVQGPPLTTGDPRPVDALPALAEALDAPDARLARHLRTWRLPWATALVAGLPTAAALVQTALVALGHPAAVAWVQAGAMGPGPTVLDGAWTTLLLSPLTHGGWPLAHLLSNLPALGWSAYRVERALGAAALLAVAAGGLLGGAALVCAFSDLPVIGSSIVGFACWGAQLAVGFRFGDALPVGHRGGYAWGNVVIFALLFPQTLFLDGVSHLGHLGGLLAGIAAVFVLPVESIAPRAQVAARRTTTLGAAAAALLATLGLPGLLAALPAPTSPAPLPDHGLTLEVPRAYLRFPARAGGLDGWRLGAADPGLLYTRLDLLPATLPQAAPPSEWLPVLQADLEARFGAPVVPLPDAAPAALPDGWVGLAWQLPPAADRSAAVLTEAAHRTGRSLRRIGLRSAGPPSPARARVLQRAVDAAVLGPPTRLTEAEARHGRAPDDPRRQYELAAVRLDTGDLPGAAPLLDALRARDDGWSWDAARLHAAAAAADPRGPLGGPPDWLDPFLAEASAWDAALLSPSFRLFAALHDCPRARDTLARVQAHIADAPAEDAARLPLDAWGRATQQACGPR